MRVFIFTDYLYMDDIKSNNQRRARRAHRTRMKVRGTHARPRLHVYRSLRSVSAQIIDDERGSTLASVHSKTLAAKGAKQLSGMEQARMVGAAIAEKAQRAGVSAVVFDRGSYRYHGVVKALAEAARAGGLTF